MSPSPAGVVPSAADGRDEAGFQRLGELFRSRRYSDAKDPCVVHDGIRWHLFGTGCGLPSGLEILHWTAPSIGAPWTEHQPVELSGVDMIPNPAAPGVVAEGRRLHMYLQHDFNVLGGHIEHLVSDDGGHRFQHGGTTLESLPGTAEAGIYDPDPAVIGGERYLCYAAMSTVGQPELFLAHSASGSWDGPWRRCGRILGHHEVDYHNQVGAGDYEWGLEGPQLVELPQGGVLLTAVCFLAGEPSGSRQRLLLAVADTATGPFRLLGPVVEPASADGENGHGTAVVDGDWLRIIYQERLGEGKRWHFRHACRRLGRGTRPPPVRLAGVSRAREIRDDRDHGA